ncbi:MAG: polyphosphate kinase 1 [Crocinitomicaceae bacterium]|nr:polyphosphate kinase 1 [Crocinitomicaceae bacterium]
MEIYNRELSWLSFNERVLQEALDTRNPVIERMRFLGIYSNNMDEFFRVRVANIRRMIEVGDKNVNGFKGSPKDLFKEIRLVVLRQQKQFEIAYQKILKELEQHNIYHIQEKDLTNEQIAELKNYYNLQLKHAIVPIMLNSSTPFPRLKDSGIYLAIKMIYLHKTKVRYALIKIPSTFSRFYIIKEADKTKVLLLDDIIRLNLDEIFSIFIYDKAEAYTFKFTRDAELNLDDDISTSLKDKVEHSIKLRKKGTPVRFVYDNEMPIDLLEYLLRNLGLEYGVNTIAGGRYHNFKDFMSFPDFGNPEFVFPPLPPLNHPELENRRSLLKLILRKDILLHYPYQRFDYLVDLLREAAIDPKVQSIKINVYRVTRESPILKALLNAISNGKQVTVFLELMARFDEENNLYWSNRLKENGAIVLHGRQDIKVHSKLFQIIRDNKGKKQYISHIGTGNFHEKTARIYGDLSLVTADEKIGQEVEKVFDLLESDALKLEGQFNELLVSPINTKERLLQLIDNEINAATAGKKAEIFIKLNNLTDQDMINHLYRANNAGVRIKMIIRGICCLVPGVDGMSENITVYSIVDRFLEHARILKFYNGGDPKYYISSADWMERNLDKRIEVLAPIKEKEVQQEIDLIFDYQFKGTAKTRIIGKSQKNKYRKADINKFHAQMELYKHYKQLLDTRV